MEQIFWLSLAVVWTLSELGPWRLAENATKLVKTWAKLLLLFPPGVVYTVVFAQQMQLVHSGGIKCAAGDSLCVLFSRAVIFWDWPGCAHSSCSTPTTTTSATARATRS